MCSPATAFSVLLHTETYKYIKLCHTNIITKNVIHVVNIIMSITTSTILITTTNTTTTSTIMSTKVA